jgi:hypothetical protein
MKDHQLFETFLVGGYVVAERVDAAIRRFREEQNGQR